MCMLNWHLIIILIYEHIANFKSNISIYAFTLFVQQSDKESCRDEVNTVGLHFFFI